MAEQWRVVVAFDSPSAEWSGVWRCKRDLARQLSARANGAMVVVGAPSFAQNAWLGARRAGQSPVCAYTGNRAAAEAAAQVAREVLGEHPFTAHVSVEVCQPGSKLWVDASAVSEAALADERDYQRREERRLSAETGIARWRVRVDLRTHRDALALGQRLSNDGRQVEQRWKYVVARADSEDDALGLAERIRQDAPPGAEVLTHRADAADYFQGGSVSSWW